MGKQQLQQTQCKDHHTDKRQYTAQYRDHHTDKHRYWMAKRQLGQAAVAKGLGNQCTIANLVLYRVLQVVTCV